MPADPRRLAAQLLAGRRATSVAGVVERLLAVQAQDPRGFRLAVRARSRGLTARDVDASLDAGECVVTWLNRGTLHLVLAGDYPWLHALTAPTLLTGNARRLAQEGVADPDRGVAAVVRALEHGPRTRGELREAVARAGVRTEGQALVHVLALASLRGHCVRGPLRGGEQAYVLVAGWLPDAAPVDRDGALRRLGQRYLDGHGPAGDRDLAKWSGLPLRDARAALRDATPPRRRDAGSPPRLLGAFDPLLLGWASRDDVVGGEARRLVTDNGLFRPCALVGGEAVATWTWDRGRVALAPFRDLDPSVLREEERDVARFLGA
ncbi:MAG TPA: winged helix DNA-binding domain-containing protein [Mycobacteriales bacterium]|jgi:hypothetical protein